MRSVILKSGLAAFAVFAAATGAMAQSTQPRLIEEARFGVIREVAGISLSYVTAGADCPAAAKPEPNGPCFQPVMKQVRADAPLRVIAFATPPREGERVHGAYGTDYILYDLQLVEGALKATPVWRETSELYVPVGCFALNGERVGYVVEGDQAWQSQYVVCDGGPRSPRGPYVPEGDVLPGGTNTYHKTESLQLLGTPRWLAYPGVTCDKIYSPRKDYCAIEAVTYLQENPDVKELDLIAARIPVKGGDVLTKKQTDQWVLKRRGKSGFKADSRWSDQYWLQGVSGCVAIQDTQWHVVETEKGLHIREKAEAWCGAPRAPVPQEIWEIYGTRDYFIVDCAEDRRGWREKREADGSCLNQAGDYLRRTNQNSATVIVLNQRARLGDLLIPGGYVSYDVARASLDAERKLVIDRDDYYTPETPYQANCNVLNDGPPESSGFILVRSMGTTFARSFRWMSCGVY